MIYQKSGFAYPNFNRYNSIFEYMFVFSKGNVKTFNPICDVKNTYFGDKVARLHGNRNKEGDVVANSAYKHNGGKIVKECGMRTNIWKYSTGGGNVTTEEYAYKHPAMFPEQLAKDHILSWSNPNDLVVDIFAGSGTTLKMAKLMGRKFIGFEISKEYVDICLERIKQNSLLEVINA